MKINGVELPVIDSFVQMGDETLVPRELFRDEESLEGWPRGDKVLAHLFKGDPDRARRFDTAGDPEGPIVAELERFGIERAQVTVTVDVSDERIALLNKHQDRYFVALYVDPHQGMRSVRAIRRLAGELPMLRSISLLPFTYNPQIPPNSKEYYPIYAVAAELGLVAVVNVGFPGMRVQSAVGDPMALDEVCWFFPELQVCMRHGGQPWPDVCVNLMLKWPNLHYSTSAFSPRHYPAPVVHYLKSRGRDKVIYAGFWPMLAFDRIERELGELDLDEDTARRFLHDNAQALWHL